MSNTSIRTATGLYFDFQVMDPKTICIEDIAHALANIPRFTGHTPFFYSVGQHSIMASAFAPEPLKLEALLHDATEAYMMDIAKPLKQLLPDYQEMELKLQKAIALRFNLPEVFNPCIKEIDEKLLYDEWFTVVNQQINMAWPREIVVEVFLKTYEKFRRD